LKTYELLIWAGLTGVTVAAFLLAGLWLAVLFASLCVLGLGLALSQEQEPTPPEAAEGLDALLTASPEVTPTAEPD
jgi:uncharacterized membrane protein